MPIEFLEHKADVLFEARAESFERVAEESARALFETIADTSKLTEEVEVCISAQANALDELLVFALSELLSEADARELFFKSFIVDSFDGKELKGTARGCERSPAAGRTDVKAVTLHECSVKKHENEWKAHILLDV